MLPVKDLTVLNRTEIEIENEVYMYSFVARGGYRDRETKAEYVWNKYRQILQGKSILDVGADRCHLRTHLSEGASYWGIGFGEVDQVVDLEMGDLPLETNSFDTVLCLDVLEHLEKIHHIFDELCRVSKEFVVISLPNPWMSFYKFLKSGHALSYDPMKFYGLPLEPPEDRHRWFFSAEEAERFIAYRAERNGFTVLHIDNEMGMTRGEGRGLKGWLRTLARRILFRNPIDPKNLYGSTTWAVLQRQ